MLQFQHCSRLTSSIWQVYKYHWTCKNTDNSIKSFNFLDHSRKTYGLLLRISGNLTTNLLTVNVSTGPLIGMSKMKISKMGDGQGCKQPRYQDHVTSLHVTTPRIRDLVHRSSKSAPFVIKLGRIIESGKWNHIKFNWVIWNHQDGSNDVINGWWRHQQ